MNNVKKFNLTMEAISNLVAPIKEEADKLFKEQDKSSKKLLISMHKMAVVSSLSIDIRKAIITLRVQEYYAQPIWVKKRRINVIPCCFLIQLYKEQLKKNEFKAELETIPFTLKGFWNMEKTLNFLDELSGKQLSWTRNIQRIMNYKRVNKANVDNALQSLAEAIEGVKILPPQKGCMEVQTKDNTFTVKTKNMKLDVVPLCKIITSYYADLLIEIEICRNIATSDVYVKSMTDIIIEDFEILIKKYFMIPFVKR